MNVLDTPRIYPLSPCAPWGDVIAFAMIWTAIPFAAWQSTTGTAEDHGIWTCRAAAIRDSARTAASGPTGGRERDLERLRQG